MYCYASSGLCITSHRNLDMTRCSNKILVRCQGDSCAMTIHGNTKDLYDFSCYHLYLMSFLCKFGICISICICMFVVFHFLKKYCHSILWHMLLNFVMMTFIQQNVLGNVMCKMLSILFTHQCVDKGNDFDYYYSGFYNHILVIFHF